MGGRGSSSGGMGGRSGGGAVSDISTGGRIIQQSSDQWFGANDNGSWVVINDSGKSDYNLYKYGNKQIYEVDRGNPDSARAVGAENPPRLYANTKAEAMRYARAWLKANKG